MHFPITATKRKSIALAAAIALAWPAWGAAMEAMKCGAHHRHMMETAKASAAKRSLASYTVPEVTLVNQKGEQLALRSLLDTDQPVLLNFIFTSCTTICPVMSASFADIQGELGDDSAKVRMVSVSIDPEYDTPVRLAQYAQRFDAGSQWQFLTGTLEDSIAVQQAFESYRGDKMNHTPLTLLRANADAQWIRYDGFANSKNLVRETRGMLEL